MRPEKAKTIVNNTIQRYLNDEPTAMYIPDMLRAVHKMQAKQAIWHKEHDYPLSDFSPDVDTDYDNIIGELEYISDRFNSQQRLAWLEVGILEGKF